MDGDKWEGAREVCAWLYISIVLKYISCLCVDSAISM